MLNDMFQYLFNEDLSKLSIGATIKFLGTFTTGYHYIAITNKWYSKWYLPSPSDFMFCWRICNYCAEKRLRIAEINNILLQVLLAGNISFWFNCFIIFLWDLEDGDVAGSLSDFDKRYVLLWKKQDFLSFKQLSQLVDNSLYWKSSQRFHSPQTFHFHISFFLHTWHQRSHQTADLHLLCRL